MRVHFSDNSRARHVTLDISKYLHLVLTVHEDEKHTEIKYSSHLLEEEKSQKKSSGDLLLCIDPQTSLFYKLQKVFIFHIKVFSIRSMCILGITLYEHPNQLVGLNIFLIKSQNKKL